MANKKSSINANRNEGKNVCLFNLHALVPLCTPTNIMTAADLSRKKYRSK